MTLNMSKLPVIFVSLTSLILAACSDSDMCGTGIAKVKDEALCVGRMADSLKGADEDYFRDMDYGLTRNPAKTAAALAPYLPGITPDEAVEAVAKGRNNWIVWTAGNDHFWHNLSNETVGNVDFLKTLSSHPALKFSRSNRWQYMGLVNEPCFSKATGPRKDRYGLWFDVRDKNCVKDPFENESKYPGIKIGARGKNIPLGSYYGYASGIVGLRIFPNPDFDANAEENWDPEKYYTDPDYYNNKDLIKPYRIGMSCGFCHVGPNPTNPPKDPENPKWENLNSNPGAQYFWVDRILMWQADPENFAYQIFHTSRPGALDTSFVSTDYINNPRTMNAVYNLGARMMIARKLGQEKLAGGGINNAQLNDFVPPNSALTQFFKKPDTVWTPRVLKDGSDSVGALGALNRVYVNIGLFSEEWLQHFRPLVGGKKISPIEISVARKNSSYWNANEAQTPDLALFFLASTRPDYLRNAPGSRRYLTSNKAKLNKGKAVFAERCARCHSSKLPKQTKQYFPDGCNGKNYLSCWDKYWAWTKTSNFKDKMKRIVAKNNFLEDNFLSTELRVPVTLIETNACSPLATNALEDNIWDNFSSRSYKDLPSVGKVIVHHPYTGAPSDYEMPAGGRGYTRPASLISLWSTAPFLLNNTVGDFYWSGSVEDRMKSFDDSIQKMLWPEKRKGNLRYKTKSGKELNGQVDVTTHQSFLRVSSGYLPDFLQPLLGFFDHWLPWLFGEGGIEIGPIPAGTPVNLVSNIDLSQRKKALKLLIKIKHDLKDLPKNATDEQAKAVFTNLVEPLIDISKCKDYIVNRGHYFGTDYFAEEAGLSDADKFALIEYLKTL